MASLTRKAEIPCILAGLRETLVKRDIGQRSRKVGEEGGQGQGQAEEGKGEEKSGGEWRGGERPREGESVKHRAPKDAETALKTRALDIYSLISEVTP